jgi:NADPH:quinone reductase
MNRQIVLKSRPVGMPGVDNFIITEAPEQVVQHGELLIKPKFISVDPYMRGRMDAGVSSLSPFEPGKPIEGTILAEVIESRHPGFRQGEMIKGNFLWRESQVVKADQATKIDKEIPSPSDHMGILGLTGLTAYIGLLEIGKPLRGETVVVSGAAGAVGVVVGQIARLKGCRVVGIAGSDEKIDFLKKELHFDEAINYHREDWEQDLTNWLKEGRLIGKQTIVKGFENLQKAFIGLFHGENIGKYLVEIL